MIKVNGANVEANGRYNDVMAEYGTLTCALLENHIKEMGVSEAVLEIQNVIAASTAVVLENLESILAEANAGK